MSLKYIITEWAKETGQPIASASQRSNALDKINKAAQELYDSNDLPGSLREQVFDMNPILKEVTLPWYVYQVRGVRHYASRDRITQNDMRPRYAKQRWIQDPLSWRIKQTVAIGHTLTNEAPLTIRLSEATGVDFSLFFRTSTSTRSNSTEEVAILGTDTEVVTSFAPTSFPGITNIEKSIHVNADISVWDASEVLIAELPNLEPRSFYTLLQVVDETMVQPYVCDPCFEILYKWKFSPFYSDYDVFPCSGYDDAIVWKAVSNFWKRKPGGESQVQIAEGTLAAILTQKAADAEGGEELELNFGTNRFQDIMSGGYPTGLYNGMPFIVP